jgi:hypothetical protein
MSVNNSVIERYAAIWNEADPEKRMDLVGWTFTEDGTYQDPILTGRGHELLNQMFGAAQAQLPGARLSLVGEPETHHAWVRFRWQITMPDESESFIEGTDVGRIGPDGRFEEIVGFLDKVPAALLS